MRFLLSAAIRQAFGFDSEQLSFTKVKKRPLADGITTFVQHYNTPQTRLPPSVCGLLHVGDLK